MDIIINNWAVIVEAVLAILGAASIIAKITPTEKDNKIIDAILKVIHSLGLTKK